MNKYTFIGNGRNKDFYFTFSFFSKADIVVKINNNTATGYSVFCIPGTNNNDFPFTGGHIHFASAPKPTDVVTIERKLQYNRLIDYQPTVALNPTTVNQDMNYFFELLKDIKGDLAGFAETYADFTDTESAQTLLTQINAVMDEIDNLGDISTINTSITNLGTSVSNLNTALTNLSNSVDGLTTTVGTHTTDIGTLQTSLSNIHTKMMPDWSAGVVKNATFTADAYGVIIVKCNQASYSKIVVKINDVIIYNQVPDTSGQYQILYAGPFPVAPNDEIIISGANSPKPTFYPYRTA